MGGGSSSAKQRETSFQRSTLSSNKQNTKHNVNDSKKDREDPHAKPSHTTYIQIINEKSSRLRLDKARSRESISIFGERINFKLDWCYASQRGYYPNAHEKANQDSYVLCENIGKNNQCHFFGVFDGHGEFGDLCSHFAANQVPANLETLLKQNCPKGLDNSANSHLLPQILTDAYISTNMALRKSRIDDSLSGTTGISVYIQNDVLYVANVGDSRAIIASEIDGNITFSPLSNDQTPYRKDERERLKSKGALIRTLDQIEGIEPIHENWGDNSDEIDESGDPPRVWDSTLERPGCAFSRSIGDGYAELVGVCAQPEVLTWKLSHRDRFVIICSDGVTEFLSSSMICDIMSKSENHLKGACRIIDEAYRLWLTYDDRTDDITMIVLSISDITPTKGHEPEEDIETKGMKVAKVNSMSTEDRPVRRVMSKTKRKEISENWQGDNATIDFDISKYKTSKTPEELERLQSMAKTNFMFQNLSSSQKDQIFSVMKIKDVKEGELIIREGDKGDEMYVIDAGEFTVLKKNSDGISQEIFTYTTAGATFGELSLMYGKPRAASIKAKTDGKLWCIGRLAFRTVLMPKKRDGLLRLFKSIHFFQDLTFAQVQCICETSYEEEFANQDLILASNDIRKCKWAIAVVLSGSLLMTPSGGGKPQSRIKESFVAAEEVRKNYSEVRAAEKTKIVFFSKNTILDVIGDIAYDNMLENINRNEDYMSAGKIQKRGMSIFSPSRINLKESFLNRSDIKLESAILVIGDYAYVGKFSTTRFGTKSGKLIAKDRAANARMDARLSQEKKILESLVSTQVNGTCESAVARIDDFFQDSKIAIFLYSDMFVCDLGLALSSNAVTDDFRPFFSACVIAAVGAVHGLGFMHRFINPGSFYITNSGTLKLVDMRYAKPMDGNMSFTICGDPLYFSPELVNQQGYDYCSDIWAIGATLLEIYEIPLPWGTLNTEETALFKAISSFKIESINFPSNIYKDTQTIICGLLNPSRTNRLGFKSFQDIKDCPYFSGFQWSSLESSWSKKVDFEASVDIATLFTDSDLSPCSEESNAYFSSI